MNFVRRLLSFALVQLVIEVLIFLVFFFLLLLGVTWLLVTAMGIHGSALASQFIVEAIFLVALWLTVFVAHKWLERRSYAAMGYARQHLVRDLLLGFLIGGVLMGSVILVLLLAGWYQVKEVHLGDNLVVLALSLLLFLIVGLFEEGAFRGIIMRLLVHPFGSWIALLLSSIAFGVVHLLNANATVPSAIAVAIEGGVMLGAAFMLTRSLWLAIGIHWAWDFFEGPVFGAADSGGSASGLGIKPLLTSSTSGPDLWTGGAFGPEGGLVALIICIIASIVLLTLVVRRNNISTPRWLSRKEAPSASVATAEGTP